MRKMNRKHFFTTFMLLVCITLQAQNFKAIYEYDANGSRITARIYYLTLKSARLPSDFSNKTSIDSINNCIIRISPNPTHGDLLIEFTGYDRKPLSKSNEIQIWDTNGRMILKILIEDDQNSIDISNLSNGTYILRICIDEKFKTYKIVKE